MYVRPTIFEDHHCALPGNVQIEWQGIGQDAGNLVVYGNVRDGDGWYIVQDVAGDATLSGTIGSTVLDGTELSPTFHPPATWWTDGVWSAEPTNLSSMEVWTIISSPLTNWYPREWMYDYLPDAMQGTTDPSDIQTIKHGDWWFYNGVSRGLMNRYYPSATVTATYNQPISWKHVGAGTAPAGEYSLDVGETTDTKTVGYWSDEAEVYELGAAKTLPVPMIAPGILRGVSDIPTPADIAADGWDFDGADWAHPDPLQWRYWAALRYAIMERESVLYSDDTDWRMGKLIPNEQALWQFSPWSPPTLEGVRAFRDAILALAQKYVDFAKLLVIVGRDDIPELSETAIDVSKYPHLSGGWERGDAIHTVSNNDLSGFLTDAYNALREMVITIPSRNAMERTLVPLAYGYAYEGDGETYQDAVDEAAADFQDYVDHNLEEIFFRWWYSAPSHYWMMATQSGGVYAVDDGTQVFPPTNLTAWEINYLAQWWELSSICFPNTSVIDGSAMAQPTILWARYSTCNDLGYHEGDAYRDGIITHIIYYSDFATQGVSHGTAQLPFRLREEFPSTAPPVDPPSGGGIGYTLYGNSTITWIYLFWGDSFKFGGPLPDAAQDEEEEEEEEEP